LTLKAGEEGSPPLLQSFNSPSLSPPRPHTTTQLMSLSWPATVPERSKEIGLE